MNARVRRCETCRFAAEEGETAVLTCHREPPQLNFLIVPIRENVLTQPGMGLNGFSGWPEVKPEQWCGEWASRMEKLFLWDATQ